MNKIQVLPIHIANQIAAGEVIERPAAVIKELVENSLDADADHVTVHYQKGGKTFLSVEDNGIGMSAEDAQLAFQRHATSKLVDIQDLQQLQSFGFRGEALPSIASVAKVLLQTKNDDDPHGTEVLYHNGTCLHHKVCSRSKGTCITVTDLFANVPARRRFLKSDTTESWHIQQILLASALVQQQVYFEVFDGHRKLFVSPAQSLWSQRCADLFEANFAEELFDIGDQEEDVSIQGALLKPGNSHFHHKTIWIFINRRWVISRFLQTVISEAYHEHLPVGRNPVAFLNISLDPSLVDINVHPQKKEVRFRNERSLRQILNAMLHRALPQHASVSANRSFEESSQNDSIGHHLPNSSFHPHYEPGDKSIIPVASGDISYRQHHSGGIPFPHALTLRETQVPFQSIPLYAQPSALMEGHESTSSRWKFIGTLRSIYALFESLNGLIILHYRAAQERIFYEELRRKTLEPKTRQELLIPIVIPPTEDEDRHKRCLHLLQEHEWDCHLNAREECIISGIPSWMDPDKAATYAQCLWISEDATRDPESYEHSLCKHYPHISISESTLPEIEAMAERLLSCQQPLMTAHGKPTYYEIPFQDIQKRF
ncbi:MAG: DNA mismatch repair endonuclease MutL [Puniceicoccales bacterium]|jgi:DNA mismatch repair protein MutL|nr:DNA mismatch repair endonuclease MutL [Puniceicoccales bacterium]